MALIAVRRLPPFTLMVCYSTHPANDDWHCSPLFARQMSAHAYCKAVSLFDLSRIIVDVKQNIVYIICAFLLTVWSMSVRRGVPLRSHMMAVHGMERWMDGRRVSYMLLVKNIYRRLSGICLFGKPSEQNSVQC